MAEQKTVSTLLLTGVNLIKSKRYQEALSIYDSVLGLEPGNADGWIGNAIALQNLDRLPQALAAYEQALTINPDNADVWNLKGVLLYKLSRYEEALPAFDRALSLSPDDATIKENQKNCTQKVSAIHHREKYGEPITDAPTLFTIWGFGARMWGDTHYLTVLWIPVFPIARYSIEPHPFIEQLPLIIGEYTFYGKLDLHPWQRTWQVIAAGLFIGGLAGLYFKG